MHPYLIYTFDCSSVKEDHATALLLAFGNSVPRTHARMLALLTHSLALLLVVSRLSCRKLSPWSTCTHTPKDAGLVADVTLDNFSSWICFLRKCTNLNAETAKLAEFAFESRKLNLLFLMFWSLYVFKDTLVQL